ncbi:hypothetical protein HMPREF2976_02465 [Corynebacterium sp. HMSC077D10]|nr:hypothetical protein HMPREF0307_01090 [Corynebacterium sp. DNF00584]OFL76594.1 hypothetical protein HMPREF2748_06765 [Corynebacterium sp. HMSC077B05]OFN42709.1 hypothetical protein HMPREF2559_01440 [Corynebacterium sp. HMSC072G08]OFP16342.1 hypothetical protein HMPREF2998_04410 [Corynebacterium sp. HMSC065A05]OFP66980.1 hypothetical protein HMPREF2976_02465 [Corynebacterium sp. HMSC077D10]
MTAQGEKVRPPAASSAGSRRWGGWEGSAFDACLVAGVRGAVEVGGAATVPPALIGVDLVEAGVGIRGEADGIKEVELGLGVEAARVRDARRCQVFLGLAGDVARVAGERIEVRGSWTKNLIVSAFSMRNGSSTAEAGMVK